VNRLGPQARRALVTAGVVAVGLVFTQFVLPGPRGQGGTPVGTLFNGLVLGLVGSLTTAGIILIYRTNHIVNFAQTAIGAAGAVLCFNLVRYTAVPFPVSFLLGLLVAAVAGGLFDLAFGRRFFKAPRLVLTVVTIAAAGFLSGISGEVRRLPFFPPVSETGLTDLDIESFHAKLPLPGFTFNIGSSGIDFGFRHLFAIETAVLLLVGLALFFRFTRAGVAVRAVAENAERAGLLGMNVGSLSTLVWVIAGVLSGAGVMLSGMIESPQTAVGFAPDLLLPALAAAVIARMRSIPIGALAAVGIAVLSEALRVSYNDYRPLVDGGLFLVVLVGLATQRRGRGRSETGVSSSWQATEEQRPIPRELADVSSLRLARRALLGVAALGVGVYPFLVSAQLVNLGAVIVLQTIVAFSLVVLTGWAGQVSLGQFGFVAVGSVVGGALTSKVGLPFWLAVPVASMVTAGFAVLVGIPALRIKGLFLGVTTFAFAVAVPVILFNDRWFGWLLPDDVERPTLFLLDFEDDRSMFFLCVACLVVAAYAVNNLRRSRWGRLLIGLRDNEPAIEVVGVSAVRTKLMAFALSGALAGFAGVVFAHQQRGVSAGSFGARAGIDVFLLAVIGGVGSTGGALLGSAWFNATRYFITNPVFSTLLGPGFTLFLLYGAPGGLISLVMRVRDEVLRVVAQRRQLVVPSLFADYDPEALERRLVPLGEPLPGTGLAALPPGLDFTMPSVLYPVVGGRALPDRDNPDVPATVAGERTS
jgi:branched-chain amino acid transport system permease protein